MTRDEVIKAAEELAKWLESSPDGHDLYWDSGNLKPWANAVRSIIALVPKEGEVVVSEEPTAKMMNAFLSTGPYPAHPFISGYKAMLKAVKEDK